MLNIVWLIAAWVGYEWFPENQIAQAYLLAVGVIISGVAQVAVHLPTLRRLGFRFDYNWSSARKGVMQIGRNMAPTFVGLSVLQINTFVNTSDRLGAGRGGRRAANHLVAGRRALSDAARGRGLPLLQRPALRFHARHRRLARGRGDLSRCCAAMPTAATIGKWAPT